MLENVRLLCYRRQLLDRNLRPNEIRRVSTPLTTAEIGGCPEVLLRLSHPKESPTSGNFHIKFRFCTHPQLFTST